MKIKDIAAALGLSVSTVSKALSNATDVSVETKKKVLEFTAGQDITIKKKGNAKRICIFLVDMGTGNEFICYDILNGFRLAANTYNYDVIVKSIGKYDNNINYNEEIKENDFLGAFIMGTNLNSSLYNQLKTTVHPSVILDNFIANRHVSTISVDNINTVSQIVDYLVSLGHRKIGMLTGEKESIVSRERLGGYISGLINNEIAYREDLVKFGNFTDASGEEYADDFINAGVTAVVCVSDLVAVGLINAFKKRGINVPRDISVTGFDDIVLSKYITPALTTISQDFQEIGKNAFTMLRQLIKQIAPDRVVMNGQLVIRDSTATVRE